MEIGEKIKKLRKERKLTQNKLSEISGISESAIRKYEKGERIPKIDVIKKIAMALEVDISELITIPTFERSTVKLIPSQGDGINLTLFKQETEEKLDKILRKISTSNSFNRISCILSSYDYKVSPDESNNITLLNNKGIKITLSEDDIRSLDRSMRFALELKLEEIINTKEGE